MVWVNVTNFRKDNKNYVNKIKYYKFQLIKIIHLFSKPKRRLGALIKTEGSFENY